ncbi:MAG: hypothetical protein OEZ31_09230 [Nitrospirota bacterium]|nr:hypothetical protein [Nitrospirota bacterium]MDH5769124.1 hypothetical protein [Nitrospirota bacterium]
MSIIAKKIGNREYAYLVVREGKRVIHKYLGAMDNPDVVKLVADREAATTVPKNISYLFWDTKREGIHLKRNARYIIERVLDYGNIDALAWLQRVYPVQVIINVLSLSRNISEKSRNFWKIWFGVLDA